MNSRFVSVLLVLVAAAGCGRAPKYALSTVNPPTNDVPATVDERRVSQLGAGDTIVWVDGDAFTRRDLDEMLASLSWRLTRSGASEKQKANVYNASGALSVSRFIEHRLLVHEARRRCPLTLEELTVRVDGLISNMAARAKMDPAEFRKGYGENQLLRDAELTVYSEMFVTNLPNYVEFSWETVTNFQQQLLADNAAITETNRLTGVRLGKLRERVLGGQESFEDVAEKYSQCPYKENGTGGYCGVYDKDDFPAQTWERICTLREGDISGLIEDDDGYYFVKVLKREEKSEKVSELRLTLARVFLNKEPFFQILPIREFKADLEKQQKVQAMSEEIGRLRKAATIVYPHGTNFWETAKEGKGK